MPTKIPQEEEQQQLKQLELEIQYHESVENTNDQISTIKKSFISTYEPIKIPKKRGPKKKQMTPSRVARFKVRRIKANGRERERMKDLNQQLERLRETIPCFSLSQKLSKIETLRLAKNYIEALTQMISNNQILDNIQFAELLCQGLSSNTINLVAATLSLNPRILQQDTNNNHTTYSTNMMTLDDTYMLSSIHPRVNNPLEFINLKKLTETNLQTSENEDDRKYNHSNSYDYGSSSSYCGDSSSIEDINLTNEQQFMFTNEHSFYYYPTHY
ncbi:unnamed protein product [Rotaria sordida]|uniref:BHLH domain-containing protein n=1 Tax=Rotaria sordida TaxID=392033 RepID=A0A815I6S6_9BILA|nr:unnamed protein product [Rotaria sordida]